MRTNVSVAKVPLLLISTRSPIALISGVTISVTNPLSSILSILTPNLSPTSSNLGSLSVCIPPLLEIVVTLTALTMFSTRATEAFSPS